MASAARLCRLAPRALPRLHQVSPTQQRSWQPYVSTVCHRQFSTSVSRRAQDEGRGRGDAQTETQILELKRLNKAFVDAATPEGLQQLDVLVKTNGFNTIEEYVESALGLEHGAVGANREVERAVDFIEKDFKRDKQSLWFDEDDPEMDTEEHDEFNEDDITSMAHGKLEEVREMRHYSRLAVWEMPLLSKLAKPFEPPKDGQVLRWRYTTYMGEFHPAEKKVVVQFAPDDLKLTPVQTEKLKKLVGSRYNPETELIKMSSESFEHQAQNKRYLSDLVDDLVAQAKDSKDTFEDVPLDLRHHKFKAKPKFPVEWRMTEERRLELAEIRKQAARLDFEKEDQGLLIEGEKIIEAHLMQKLLEEQTQKEQAAELLAVPARRQGGARARR